MGLFSKNAVSLSTEEARLLKVIATQGEVCGADAQTALANSGKEMRLATLFGNLIELEKKKLIFNTGMSRAEAGGRPRRLFSTTPLGMKMIAVLDEMAAA